MSGALRKVQSGQKFEIPAAAYNSFVDAAMDLRRRNAYVGQKAQSSLPQAGTVLVRNDSGVNLNRFAVLGIDAPIITPMANENEFKNRIALSCVTPGDTHVGKFVILAEPLATGAIGRAYVDGVCPAKVSMNSESHQCAEVATAAINTLSSCDSGTASLLWVEPIEQRSTPGVAWVVARFGGGGGGSSIATAEVIQSLGTSVPYTYQVKVAAYNGSGEFTTSGDAFSLINLAEYGPNGSGMRKLPVGSIIDFFLDANGYAFTNTSNYRGTYL